MSRRSSSEELLELGSASTVSFARVGIEPTVAELTAEATLCKLLKEELLLCFSVCST